ncbi:DUF1365 domain-containing protein [Phycicoccus sp.]|uniref:DUF1365 domain-containing protein n=1 Tax=Phycicoccus sp. TaxID=1902410 RepID=UPI002C24CF85|nr:DUF1365 domain-containing protein [Phycicoccus sp.]HMM95081.1 DUF1365 domain-containing protein [Phycicoccus sp.]
MTTTADLPVLPALVVGEVHHTRFRPVRHAFTHRHTQWLVDLDAMPRIPFWLRPFASFRAEDHLSGNPGTAALKANVLRVLEREGVDTTPHDRVVMLAHARVLGHVFDPMSAFWVFTPSGALRGVVVEVHNTYGGRHAYVLRPDATGRDDVEKAFYVSPFNDVEGEYAIRLTLTPRKVGVAIRLRVHDEPLVTATVTGTPRPATTAQVARTAVRYPLMPQRVTALIRVHGIWLWLRRLPVRPRPDHSLETVR